ncbi:unnamed protein product [Effrenium voratum]|nr:unnamed protein product [Effrenium voratum]
MEDVEDLEEALQKELQDLEQEVQVLEERLDLLQHLFQRCLLEALPLEQLCLQLPSRDFAAFGAAGRHLHAMQKMLPQLLLLLLQQRAPEALRLPRGPPLALWRALREPKLDAGPAGFSGRPAKPLLGRGLQATTCAKALRLCCDPCEAALHEATWKLGSHLTPSLLRLQLHAVAKGAASEMSLSLLDSAVPKQPLLTLSWGRRCSEEDGISISIREVVSWRSSWAYRQQKWRLRLADLSHLRGHLEMDWQLGRCWALLQDHCEELQLDAGAPTVDELRLQLSPGSSVEILELLLG